MTTKEHVKSFLDNYFNNHDSETLKKFLSDLNISKATLSRWRSPSDTNGPTLDSLIPICKSLNISIEELLGSNDYSKDELELINKYRTDSDFKSYINNYKKRN